MPPARPLRRSINGDPACWLRTGDLAFLDDAGELYITGRIKELVIIRGINHYPQDIERTVQNVDPALRNNGGAVFSVSDENGDETLAVVQEVERVYRRSIDIADMVGRIREAVANEHDVFARHVVLIRPGALPKTTSGKIQRGVARQLWLEKQPRCPDRGRRLSGYLGRHGRLICGTPSAAGCPARA